MRKGWHRAGLIVAFGVIAAAAHQHVPLQRVEKDWDEYFVPRPELAKVTALGFDAVVADAYWLLAVQIVGSESLPVRYAPLLGQLVDVVTTLDPWVDHPYRFAGLWLTDSEESVLQGNRLLQRGIDAHPDEWRNRFYLGFNQYYYLGDQAKAAEVLEGAARLPGSPVFLRRLVARLRADSGGLEAAATFLRELVRTAPDGYARAEYEKALDEIDAERRARFLDEARAVFRRRTGRDITGVEDLVSGPDAVLRALPAEPNGWEWVLDEKTGRIVSSYYRRRYEISVHPGDRHWQKLREQRQREASGGAA